MCTHGWLLSHCGSRSVAGGAEAFWQSPPLLLRPAFVQRWELGAFGAKYCEVIRQAVP